VALVASFVALGKEGAPAEEAESALKYKNERNASSGLAAVPSPTSINSMQQQAKREAMAAIYSPTGSPPRGGLLHPTNPPLPSFNAHFTPISRPFHAHLTPMSRPFNPN